MEWDKDLLYIIMHCFVMYCVLAREELQQILPTAFFIYMQLIYCSNV